MVVGAPDTDGLMITSTGGSEGSATGAVRRLVERLKAFFSRLGLEGGAVVASLVGSLAFAALMLVIDRMRGDG